MGVIFSDPSFDLCCNVYFVKEVIGSFVVQLSSEIPSCLVEYDMSYT